MKKEKVILYLVAFAAYFCVFTHFSIKTDAYNSPKNLSPVQVGCTDASITLDFSDAIKSNEQEIFRSGNKDIVTSITGCTYGIDGKEKTKISGLKLTNYRYTFTGLESGKKYIFDFSYTIDYKNKNTSAGSSSNRRFNAVGYTYKDISNTVNIKGVTATTITVDVLDAIRKYSNRYSYIRGMGIAEVNNNSESAIAQARSMASQCNPRLSSDQYIYTFTKLKPNTQYYVSIGVITSEASKYKLELMEATLVTTASADKASIDDKEENQADYETNDSAYPVANCSYESRQARDYFDFKVTGNSLTITVKDSDKYLIQPSSKTNKISVGYAEETIYNASEKYYPDDKKALEMADTGKYAFKTGEKKYTINGITTGKTYTVIIKANIKPKTSAKGSDIYFVSRYVNTGYDAEAEKNKIEAFTKKGYEFDIVKIHRGNHSDTAYLDWTEAKNKFIKQKALAPYLAEYGYDDCHATISYYPLPDDTQDKNKVSSSYLSAKRQNWKNGGNEIPVDTSKSRLRVYGLDRNKKYVFVIGFNYRYFVDHTTIKRSDYFYCDESGMNLYNPNRKFTEKIVDDKKEDENKPSGGDNSGYSNTTEKKAENSYQKSENKDFVDSQYATFTQSSEKVSLRKLKKKAQKISITVGNSDGKITVKNKSSKKLKDYLKITVKNRKITAKLKKGAKKGTYKFQVKVAADGSTKETVKTIKIVVK